MTNTISPKPVNESTANASFSVKVSSKFQIVLPKKMREAMNIKLGQPLYFYTTKDGEVVLTTKSPMERAREYFKGKNVWGEDPVEVRRREGAEWDAKLEKIYDSLS